MKSKIVAVFALLATLVAGSALANGTWSNVTILSIKSCTSECNSPNGSVLVQLSANQTGSTCATTLGYVAIDVSSAGGAYAASQMMNAKLTSATLTSVTGTGTCAIWSGVETLSTVQY